MQGGNAVTDKWRLPLAFLEYRFCLMVEKECVCLVSIFKPMECCVCMLSSLDSCVSTEREIMGISCFLSIAACGA